jgi:hypothetical protein
MVMPSSGATLLLAVLEDGATDEGATDDSATEAADELVGALLDDLLAPPPLPPQATRPMIQVLSKLVFRLKSGILLSGLVIADSLIVFDIYCVWLLFLLYPSTARILTESPKACARLNLFEPAQIRFSLNWEPDLPERQYKKAPGRRGALKGLHASEPKKRKVVQVSLAEIRRMQELNE